MGFNWAFNGLIRAGKVPGHCFHIQHDLFQPYPLQFIIQYHPNIRRYAIRNIDSVFKRASNVHVNNFTSPSLDARRRNEQLNY
jgi:hypothetical protein